MSDHYIYICRDASGDPVYVGRSRLLDVRMRAHANSSPWWPLVVTTEAIPCDGHTDARLRERDLIESLNPPGNVNDAVPLLQSPRTLPEPTAQALRDLNDAAAGTARTSDETARLDGFIVALRRAGWPLAAIGVPLGITREGVRLRAARGTVRHDIPAVPPVPPRPVKPKPVGRRERARALLTPAVVARLRELHALARRVRGNTAAGSPGREATAELAEQLAALVGDGAIMSQIDRALGIAVGSTDARLRQHGYRPLHPSQKAYIGHPVLGTHRRGRAA